MAWTRVVRHPFKTVMFIARHGHAAHVHTTQVRSCGQCYALGLRDVTADRLWKTSLFFCSDVIVLHQSSSTTHNVGPLLGSFLLSGLILFDTIFKISPTFFYLIRTGHQDNFNFPENLNSV